ncbi:DUF6484 domain-containing protein [Mesorhizobium atlanticum]|uniref:DUF6484 domain-containing protein n=1 Tax=Mesorhizobium atlanticum TaxID=2233532 RepID=A0A330GH18_9HYPH|nr:DUF6484 domain-containing protein [Mesorhizobium atlanticum]RAZ71668.1 hypothetical protein DPM35_30740 [Mesorhizobium atlanticum]
MMEVLERIEGVVIGLLIGFEGGAPLVVFVGNPSETAIAARSLTELDTSSIGSELALLFEGGDPMRPLVVGRIVDPANKKQELNIVRDGSRVVITGEERIELRCGSASIILEKDGRVTVRGTQLTSQASGTNRIRGGAVHLN